HDPILSKNWSLRTCRGGSDLLAELKKKPGIHAVHMAGGNKAEIAPTISESG
ncbi:hypothetical protein, partial [Mycobacterium tuberculosis]|uniref:hypothetical protein n=1 Tax=Mycobacterium tuberculosis TaxID=1773 RepID=UPI000A648DC5